MDRTIEFPCAATLKDAEAPEVENEGAKLTENGETNPAPVPVKRPVCDMGELVVTLKGVLRMHRFVRFRVDKAPRECTVDQPGLGGPPVQNEH